MACSDKFQQDSVLETSKEEISKTVKLQSLVQYLVYLATSVFYENASIRAKSMKLGRDTPWAWGNYFGAKLACSDTFNENLS